MENIPVKIIRSRRKTLGLQIDRDGSVIARAPLRMPEKEILSFVSEKSDWIRKHQQQLVQARDNIGTEKLTRADLERLCQEAMRVIPPKVAHYAKLIGVTYGRITIRNQKTKWGSCSSLGNLNFNRLVSQLRNFYSGDPAFQVQLDSYQRCIIVRGTAIQHEAVEKLIEEIREGGMADSDAYLQTYTVKNSSAYSALYSVFYELGSDIDMYRDSTGKLIVFGREDDHKLVQNVLELLAEEETELAIFPLTYVDSQTAQQVFSMIETDGTYADVRYDANSNQLFVRATPNLLEEIRRVLIQMGEKELEKMKPFATTSKSGAVSTNGKRFYLRDNDKRQRQLKDDEAATEGRIDIKDLEHLDVEKTAATEPTEPTETQGNVAQGAAPKLQIKENSGQIRTVTIDGGNTSEIIDAAIKQWKRDNPVKVVQGDGGIVQTKEAEANSVEQTQPAPAPAVEPAPAPTPAPAPAVEPAPAQAPAPTNANAAAIWSPILYAVARNLVSPKMIAFGALVDAQAQQEAEAPQNTEAPQEAKGETNQESQTRATQVEGAVPQAPGVYVVVNPDGSILLSSSDENALEEFQRNLTNVVEEMKTQYEANRAQAELAAPQDATTNESGVENDEENNAPLVATTAPSDDPESPKYLSYMTEENLAKARERVLLESRQYTVYKIENVGVSQIVPRLQTYLADRISANRQRGQYGYGYGYEYVYSNYGSGINMRTISNATPLTFQPDVALNTLMVYGSKADRDAVGAMIVLLDDVDLFPQPITKPYKIRVENTSAMRMAQQVLKIRPYQRQSAKLRQTLVLHRKLPQLLKAVLRVHILLTKTLQL